MKKAVILGIAGLFIIANIGLAAAFPEEDYRRATAINNLEELKIKEIRPTVYAFKSLDGDVIEIGSERHSPPPRNLEATRRDNESPPQPYLKLTRWDSEVSLKVEVPYVGEEVPDFYDNNRLKWSNDTYEVEFYPKEPAVIVENGHEFTMNENGGVELDLILRKKPASNVFRFPIETKGLKFYYQPPLHPEHPTWADEDGDGNPDLFTTENVVGSYAVYHETQDKLWKTKEEAEKYKTGKAFHIYRPKVYDAEENETWGELYIDETEGVLTITVDQDWLNSAKYPVRIDPNFGYETAGSYLSCNPDRIDGSWFTCPESGTADSLTMWITDFMAGAIKGAIYKKSDYSLVVGTEEKHLSGGNCTCEEYTFTLSGSPSLSNIDYYLVRWTNGAGVCIHLDAVGTSKGAYEDSAYGTTWPGTWSPTPLDVTFSIYCTYTARTVTSCNSAGVETNEFAPGENVSVKAEGLEPDTDYTIWIQDNPVEEDEGLYTTEDPSGGDEAAIEEVRTNETGYFGPTLIWEIPDTAPVTHDQYDIVVNKGSDKADENYNAADDGLDSATVAGIIAPVPDVSALALFASGLVLVLVYSVYGKRKKEVLK